MSEFKILFILIKLKFLLKMFLKIIDVFSLYKICYDDRIICFESSGKKKIIGLRIQNVKWF